MEFNKEEVYNAFDVITCQVQDSDMFGWVCKQLVKNVLSEYFKLVEKEDSK